MLNTRVYEKIIRTLNMNTSKHKLAAVCVWCLQIAARKDIQRASAAQIATALCPSETLLLQASCHLAWEFTATAVLYRRGLFESCS